MLSSWYCPTCGRRLREIRSANSGVETDALICIKGHYWSTFADYQRDPQTIRFTGNLNT